MSMQERDDSALGILMSFGDHLEELRRRILLGIVVPVPVAILLFAFAGQIRSFLCIPLVDALLANGLPGTLQVMSPLETLMIDMKLSLIGAFIVGVLVLIASFYLVIVLEILKLRRFSGRSLRRRRAATPEEVDADVAEQLATGDFPALDRD